MKVFLWQFIDSMNTSYPHQAIVYAETKERAIELLKLEFDINNKFDAYNLKSIMLNEPQIYEIENAFVFRSKC